MKTARSWTGRLHVDHSWAAFRGASSSNTLHRHVALQLCIGLDGPIGIVDADGQSFRGQGLMVRPGARHRLEPSPDVLLVFVEPQTVAAQTFLELTTSQPIASIPHALRERLVAQGALPNIMAELAPAPRTGATLDARLEQALAFLIDAPAADAISQAARFVGLSPSRLRALAHAELGVALAPWVMWRKLERASAAIMAGAGLAQAAAEGGFADQAHFGRAMRHVFGITPGELGELATSQDRQAKRTRPYG